MVRLRARQVTSVLSLIGLCSYVVDLPRGAASASILLSETFVARCVTGYCVDALLCRAAHDPIMPLATTLDR